MLEDDKDNLTIFFWGSFIPIANGGNARLAQLLDRIHLEFERVVLYCYSNHPNAPWTSEAETVFRRRWPRIELVLEHYGSMLRRITRLKNLLIPLFPKWADWLIRSSVPGTTPKFDALKRRSGVFILSYTEALTQVNGIEPDRCFVETHDVNFVKWSKIHQRNPIALTPLRKFRGEIALLEPVRTAIAISPPEFGFFRMLLAQPDVAYVSSWNLPTPIDRGQGASTYDLVFVGSDYVMNARGLCDLLAAHGHWLAKYRFAVCGRVCNHAAVIDTAMRFPNVTLMGFVDDVDAVYRSSRAAISPVDGTGVKMKIFAALSFGLPVFASAKSQEGLPPGFREAVFDIDEANMTSILDHEDRRQAASIAAEAYHAVLNGAGEASSVLAAMRALVPTNGKPGANAPRAEVA